jgi:hypothetical protein
MDELLPDRRGIGVVARGLRAEDAEVDRDQGGAQPILGLDVVCPGQADQATDFLTDIGANVLFGCCALSSSLSERVAS